METTEQFEANILIGQLSLDATMETSGAVALARNFNARLTELEQIARAAQTPSAPAPTIVAPSVTSSAVPPEVQTITPEDVGEFVLDIADGSET